MTTDDATAAATNEYFGLQLNETALCEMDGARAAVQILRTEIRSIELCHGLAAERPALTVVLGALLMLWGAFFVRDLVLWYFRGGIAYDFEAFAVALIPLGVWLVHYAFRKRYLVKVSCGSTTRKLAFANGADERGARQFVELLGRAVPCHVRIDLPPGSSR